MMASAPDLSGQAVKFALDRGERIVERIHEDAAHGVDDERALAVLGVDQRRAAAGRAVRIIDRADQPRRSLDEHQRLALIPGMIAERDGVGAGIDQFVVDRFGDAEAAGGVLAVDHDEVELPIGDQPRQPLIAPPVRPLRPTTSPMNRDSCIALSSRAVDHLALR